MNGRRGVESEKHTTTTWLNHHDKRCSRSLADPDIDIAPLEDAQPRAARCWSKAVKPGTASFT